MIRLPPSLPCAAERCFGAALRRIVSLRFNNGDVDHWGDWQPNGGMYFFVVKVYGDRAGLGHKLGVGLILTGPQYNLNSDINRCSLAYSAVALLTILIVLHEHGMICACEI